MTPRADRLRFYVDESALGLGKTLAAARDDVIHAGHPLIPECPVGTPDPEWIAAVAKRNLIVIVRDKKIRTRPVEVQALRDAGLRVFLIGGKRDATTWGWLEWVVRGWETVEEVIRARGDGPWFYVIHEKRVVELEIGH